MSEATKNRRPSSGAVPAPVLTVILPAGDSTASGLGKKSAAALGKTLKKAAKAADEAGLAVTLDLDALSNKKQPGDKKQPARDKASARDTSGAEESATKGNRESRAVEPAAAAPAPAGGAVPSGRRTARTARTAQPAPKTAAPKTAAPKTVATKTVATKAPEPSAAGGGTDSTAAPSGARRPRPTPRRTPARPPVTG
jgi:hypothetical protein